jgi:hypothetical protein
MLVLALYGIAALAFVDGVRRPASQWLEADRNRGYWLTAIVLLNVVGALLYLVFVLPRFPAGSSAGGEMFLKGTTTPPDLPARGLAPVVHDERRRGVS